MADQPENNGSYDINPQALPQAETEQLIPLGQQAESDQPQEVSFQLDSENPIPAESDDLSATIVKHSQTESEDAKTLIPELGEDELSQAELTSLKFQLDNNARLAVISRNAFVGIVIVGLLMASYFFFRFQATEQSAFKANLSLGQVVENQQTLEQDYNFKIYQVLNLKIRDLVWDGMELIQHQQIQSQQVASVRSSVQAQLEQIGAITDRLTVFEHSDPKAYRSELIRDLPKNLEAANVQTIIRNKPLHEEIANQGRLAEVIAMNDAQFTIWLQDFLTSFELAETVLLKINQDRLVWSKIIAQIETNTRKIDPFFGDPDRQFISYSNYNFNARTNQITVTGQVRTEDAKTFTRIANLIDAIENDPVFTDVKTRSFTKNPVPAEEEELEDFYQATLKLDFQFVKNGDQAEAEAEAEANIQTNSETS